MWNYGKGASVEPPRGHAAWSNVTVDQLDRLTNLAKQVQRTCFGHVHQVGNLLPGSALDLLSQIYQINRDWRRHLSIRSTGSGWRLVQGEGF